MKIQELRLLDITIKQNDNVIYKGKTEEMPDDFKDKEYSKIFFEGTGVIVEI